ncbi:MAG: hypothetical protein K0U37_00050, partial [Gammaproteobacteria bacterium]|nr:hypothetical protein [Gammaproteobacteria bacterium]
ASSCGATLAVFATTVSKLYRTLSTNYVTYAAMTALFEVRKVRSYARVLIFYGRDHLLESPSQITRLFLNNLMVLQLNFA